MTDTDHSKLKADIISEACAWIVQIEEGNLTPADQSAFQEWMNRGPAHRNEIKRLAQLSSELNVLTDMMPSLDAAILRRKRMRKSGNKRKITMSLAIASSILVLALFSGIFPTNPSLPISDVPVLYTTIVGGQRDVRLSDGSEIKLNTDTEVEVDFTSQRRKIRLIKGEAFFLVAHNPDRPFLVYAGDNVVRAVGTAFIVRHLKEKFEITVTEGRVELKPEKNDRVAKPLTLESPQQNPTVIIPAQTIAINAGETIVFEADTQVDAVEQQSVVEKISVREIERELSWQDGLLEFSDTPLSEAIADLSRYTTLKIEIADPELRDLKFGGLFRTDELSVLFETLETNFDIRVEYESDDLVRISHSNTQH